MFRGIYNDCCVRITFRITEHPSFFIFISPFGPSYIVPGEEALMAMNINRGPEFSNLNPFTHIGCSSMTVFRKERKVQAVRSYNVSKNAGKRKR